MCRVNCKPPLLHVSCHDVSPRLYSAREPPSLATSSEVGTADGLVVDVGGRLSHGAIVAREYGLPAVVNVKAATRLVRTGQTITVNGATGEVWVA